MDYQAKLNEEMAQRNQQRQNEYFGMTAKYNSAESQKQRLIEAGLNPALMYGSAGSGGAGTDHAMDGDDGAYSMYAPSFIGSGNFFTLSSEGGFELPSTASNIGLSPTTGWKYLSIPGISHYFTTAGISSTRLCLSFHPPYDAGTSGVKVRGDTQRLICGGDIALGGGQVVSFALLIDKPNLFFDLYLSTGAGSSIPIYAQELDASGYVAGSQVLVSTMPVNSKLQVHGGLHNGLFGGHVYDATGAGVS